MTWGGSYAKCASLFLDDGRTNEGLAFFDKAIASLVPILDADPRDVKAKLFLRNSYLDRANAHEQLQEHTAAVKDWDRAIELSPPAEQGAFRASRATSRLRDGQVFEAVADVDELTNSSNWNAGQLFDFAIVYSAASGKIADKKSAYGDRAIELLQQAVKAGWSNVAHMKQDTDLDPLREREDFKKILSSLEQATTSPAK